jgi:hypothetical protein
VLPVVLGRLSRADVFVVVIDEDMRSSVGSATEASALFFLVSVLFIKIRLKFNLFVQLRQKWFNTGKVSVRVD